ncbi:TPA: anti-adapter protein IraP [Escherichia coli]|nr:anti-adapter protein IraP [Escherichia coli]HBD3602700.1 anti-adapter protein IraP [Escherichia coli]HBE5139387.1 anti-adapter protein IraP [Escherichia coli]
MKNLIAELLFKLAHKEEESKELCAQVEALEIIVTAMLRNMAQNDQQRLIDQVEGALYEVKPDASIPDDDTELLRDYVKKLLKHPRQ